nr:caffeic acid 3-O-methyltransferase-like [Tanacetum cinerariifolium]
EDPINVPFVFVLSTRLGLTDSVMEGGVPFDNIYGARSSKYPAFDARFNAVFNKAMVDHTTIVMKEVLESYHGFKSIKSMVDVGGGLGVNLNMIVSKYPAIKGINFDQPHVIEHAPNYPGITHVGGDMFDCVPKGDVIFMKWLLGNVSDDEGSKLLKNCYNALPDDGKVILVEAILPFLSDTSSATKVTTQMDTMLMTKYPGGKERTEDEYLALFEGTHDSKLVRVYGLTPVAKYFIPNEDGVALSAFMELLTDKILINSWLGLTDSVMEGGVPFDNIYGARSSKYPAFDARFNAVFNKAMVDHTTIVMKEVLESYHGFKSIKSMVDVGGGLGVNLNMIVSKYPAIKGINFDQPHVIEHAPNYPGITHVGGDMFDCVPKGDVIFMKWLLGNVSDDEGSKLLKNCYNALPDDGKVILVEAILPFLSDTSSATKVTTQMDTMLMTKYPGGKERTEDEYLALFEGAGFTRLEKTCFVCNLWVMEIYK